MAQGKAVIVVDVQNALCHGVGATFNAMKVIARINRVMRKAREDDVSIIFVQHEEESGPFAYQTKGWQLPNELDNYQSDIYVRKTASDSFKNTDLKFHLDGLNVNHLIICGMQSEFCVDSTIRCALAHGYTVTVIADGHTTFDNHVLAAETISKHHNCTWENITSYGPRVKAIPADNINFKKI